MTATLEQARTAPGMSPPRTRAQELRSYDVADFAALTGLEEQWRFTPLARLRGLATADGSAAGEPPSWRWAKPSSGVVISSQPRPAAGAALVPFDRISALAFGQAQRALRIDIEAGARVGEPVTVSLDGTGATSFGHTVVRVGELAEATIVLEQTGSTVLADNVEVLVGDGAQLTLVTLALWDADAVQAQHLHLRLGRDARATHIQVALGGNLVRQYVSVDYTGRGGDAQLYGLYFAGAGQHLEHRLLVDHSVPDCRSRVTYRGALQGEAAHTVWVGDVLIRAGATGTDTYEVNRNLLLSDGARADSVPNLEIETGEVVGAGHASATGRFDDEALFYLTSRGIPPHEARRLVVRGFFAELLDLVPVQRLRERLGVAIEDRLAKVGA